ncbi:MAG: M48 family metallopeptidase [Candidatus Aminicenantales bacterium]
MGIVDYSVKRGRRRKRTVSVQVTADAKVVVLAPRFVSDRDIEALVKKKSEWIIGKQADLRRIERLHPPKTYTGGEEFLFLGGGYALDIREGPGERASRIDPEARKLIVRISAGLPEEERREEIRAAVSAWYRAEAPAILDSRVRLYAREIGVLPKGILVREQARRWGSCSGSGILRFNWKLVMAPLRILDYVVVHEICHLKVRNHSKAFWEEVGRIVPDYKDRRAWLRGNAHLFRL